MDTSPQFKLDRTELRRDWQRYRQRQYQLRLVARFIIRTAIWLLSVYLVQQWDVRVVPFYLVLSLVLLAAALLSGDSAREGEQNVGAHAAARPLHMDAMHAQGARSGDGEANEEIVGREGDDPADALRAAQGPRLDEHVRRRGAKPAYAAKRDAQRIDAADGADVFENLQNTSVDYAATSLPSAQFSGVLTQRQQRALLLCMKGLGTPGATRCAMDVRFRRTLATEALQDASLCPCGSGASFGVCCATVKDELLRIVREEEDE